MRTIPSRHVTCLLLLGYCRVSYPKSSMPGKVPGHHKFSWPIASGCQQLKMSRNGKWWTVWINISGPNTTFFLASARAARGDLGRRHKLSLKIKVRKGHRKRQELRDLTHVIVFSRLSSVNRLQAHFDANQPARGSTFVLQSCVLPHERVTTEIHGFENVWHRKGCFAWNRW